MKVVIGLVSLALAVSLRASTPPTTKLDLRVKPIWTSQDHRNLIQYSDRHQPGQVKNVEIACSNIVHMYASANGDGTCDFTALCVMGTTVWLEYYGTQACSTPQ